AWRTSTLLAQYFAKRSAVASRLRRLPVHNFSGVRVCPGGATELFGDCYCNIPPPLPGLSYRKHLFHGLRVDRILSPFHPLLKSVALLGQTMAERLALIDTVSAAARLA